MDIRQASLWSLGEAFTFLFVTLGPLNVIAPFAAMTKGRALASKRRLAFKATLLATIAPLTAATLGAKALQAWGVSAGALLLAAGAILFLVALQPVLAGYNPGGSRAPSLAAADRAPSESELAFSPLAFPTIVTPYGLALLVLLFTLYPWSQVACGFCLSLLAYLRWTCWQCCAAISLRRFPSSNRASTSGMRNWCAPGCIRRPGGGGWFSFAGRKISNPNGGVETCQIISAALL
jgi:small neutral amino acid transporter SnatA (MarC family)